MFCSRLVAVLLVLLRWWLIASTDVDECAERLDSCVHGMEMCINDLGRYHCEPLSADAASTSHSNDQNAIDDDSIIGLCPAGFYYDENELVCIGQQQ